MGDLGALLLQRALQIEFRFAKSQDNEERRRPSAQPEDMAEALKKFPRYKI
jgi:hypothetical protein